MVSKLVVTLMIRPQPRLIIGSAANRAIRNAPMQLIARIRCQPSASASKNLIRASLSPAAVDMLTPAQLIRMSSAPKVSTVRRTASRQSAAFDTSATMARNFPAKTGSAARRSRLAESISTAATLAPAAASARAITRPMPLAAPVTMAARPSSNCCSAMTRTSRADDDKSRRTMQLRAPARRPRRPHRARRCRGRAALRRCPCRCYLSAGASAQGDGVMWRAKVLVASLAAVLTFAAGESGRAQDQLKVAVGGRGIGETFVTEVGYKAGLFTKQNLVLDIFYTDGGGETQQAIISNSAQIGVASGFLGAIGVFAKGAPVRIIGASYTGGAQVFWYVPA